MTKLFSHLSLIVALVGYSISSGLFLHAFPQASKREKIHKAAFKIFIFSSFMIALALGLALFGPYYSQSSGLVLITAMSLITIIAHTRFKIKMMGIFVSPLATLILIFLAFSYPTGDAHIKTTPPGALASFHIIVSILGQAFAIAAFAISLLYLFQQRALKRKQLNFISSATPPLDKLENFLMTSLWTGFSCLSLGLISGAVYTGFFVTAPVEGIRIKIAWAISVWVWYLCILLAKNVFSKSGSVVAKMSLFGFLLLLFSFFGLQEWGGVF